MRKISVMIMLVATVMGLSLLLLAQQPVESILKSAPTVKAYPGMNAVRMLNEGEITYLADGSEIGVIRSRLCLLTHEGVKDYGEVKIPYDADLEEIHLDYARTILPDGKVVVPEKSAIHEVTPPELEDAPMYSSIKQYTISMPALKPGAIIDYQVTVKDKKTAAKEIPFFSGIWYFASKLPVQTSRFVVHVPRKTPLRWQVKGIDLSPTVQTDSDTVTYTFLKNDVPAIGYEPYMPDLDALSPIVDVTTLSSWDDIATWYNDLSADRIQTNSDIVAKVHALTDGIQTPSEKISAIYEFVARKVRYVALEFGIGSYQPHPAAETFANRYGDCKDQTTLLVTMLRAAGFDAYPVLLLVGNGIDADFSLLPTPQMFNHVITAVRLNDKWLFLDPTCDICTTSYLPFNDQNRHVMIILGKEGNPSLITSTGPFKPDATYVNSDVNASLSPEGNLKGKAKITTGGEYNLGYRDLLLAYRPDERVKLFGQVLNATIPGAKLTAFDYSDLDDVHTPVMLTEEFKKDGFAQSAAGMLLFVAPYPAQIPYPQYFAATIGQETRTYQLMVLPKDIEEQTTITVPARMSIQLPDNVSVTNDIGSFTARYAYTGAVITVTRTLRVLKTEVPPDKYPLFKEIIKALLDDANAMIMAKPES